MKTIQRFLKDESGATAIEYGLIAAMISIAAILLMGEIGDGLRTTFTNVRDGLTQGNNSSQ